MTTHNDNQSSLETIVTPENVKAALELLKVVMPPLMEIMKKRLVEQTTAIGLINQKIDQVFTSEIYSGLSAINDAAITNNEETRQKRLSLAEDYLLKNTQLNPRLETGGRKNGYWMAQANYGCMRICSLRGDEKIAQRHLLSTFECDPRLARTELAPEIWEKIFKPECKGLYIWFNKEQETIKNTTYGGRVALEKAGAAAKFAGKGALIAWSLWANKGRMPAGSPQFVNDAQNQLSEDWNDATPEKYQEKAIEKLKAELEDKIDERCRQYALKLIAAI